MALFIARICIYQLAHAFDPAHQTIWWHLIGNMLYLWVFGNNIEDAMGHVRFLIFYLLCGACAALINAGVEPDSIVPTIGASGAVSGVLGAYLVLHPRSRVLVLIFLGFFIQTVRLPAVIVLGFWIVLQLFSAVTESAETSGVAVFAHIGGFIAGMVLIGLFRRRDLGSVDHGNGDGPWGQR